MWRYLRTKSSTQLSLSSPAALSADNHTYIYIYTVYSTLPDEKRLSLKHPFRLWIYHST